MAAAPKTHVNESPDAADSQRATLAAKNRRAIAWLAGITLLAGAWVIVSMLLGTITGRTQADGIIGVILGLYVSSFPARHFVDLLIYWKTEVNRFSTRTSLGWWIALNAAVLLAGWLVIVFAAARFTAKQG
ncbi:MAG: hypothetical protein A2177_06565 [Spirochaetes bacterium RBG_13_68_11]|nr:MAG: hypothetical protein A2177_06565 [Spirochaetes bacterium RBG_13_68_11]